MTLSGLRPSAVRPDSLVVMLVDEEDASVHDDGASAPAPVPEPAPRV